MANANYKRQVIIYDLIMDGNVVFTGTADEIAEKLGISPVTVYTRHRKGIHILQEKRREIRTLTRKSREEKERRKVWVYQLFKDGEWLFTGTREKCAQFLGVKLGYLSQYEQRNGIERVKLHMEEVSCDEEPPEDKIEVGEVVSSKEDKQRFRKYSTIKAAVLCGL